MIFTELIQTVEPFLSSIFDGGQKTLPQVPGNPPMEGTSSSLVVKASQQVVLPNNANDEADLPYPSNFSNSDGSWISKNYGDRGELEGECSSAPASGSGNATAIDLTREREGPTIAQYEYFYLPLFLRDTLLTLPPNHPAPELLKTHMQGELRLLFMIGRKRAVSESVFNNWIAPLDLNNCSVEFCDRLAERIADIVSDLHRKGGPFHFRSTKEKALLYDLIKPKPV